MSDTDSYEQAGVPVHQEFTPMPEAERPKEKTYSGPEAVREAAADLVTERGGHEPEPVEVGYWRQNDEGAVERSPREQTVSAEKAAADLSAWRDGIVQDREQQSNQLTAEVIDNLRANRLNPDLQSAEQPADQAQPAQPDPISPQPEAQPDDPLAEYSPVVREALSDPKFRQTLQDEVGKVHEAARSYTEAARANAQMSMASLFAAYPELAGVPADQVNLALKVMHSQNPERALQAAAHVQAVKVQIQEWERHETALRQQADRHYQAAFAEFAKAEDAKLEAMHPELKDPAVSRQMGEQAISTLRNAGISDGDIGKLVRGEASLSLRDHRAQKILIAAAKWENAQAAIKQANVRTVPPVQRPGTSADRHDDDSELSALSRRFTETGDPRDGAKLLQAQRSARR